MRCKGISQLKVAAESPDFLIEFFRRVQEENPTLAVDEALHAQVVETGVEAVKSGNFVKARMIIAARCFGNRVSTRSGCDRIVELAHLSWVHRIDFFKFSAPSRCHQTNWI